MANIVVTETASNISVNSTSNVVTVTNTPANISFATTSAVSNAAVREALSVTDSGGDGSLTYSNTSGIFNYTGPSASEVRAHFSNTAPITYNSSTGVIGLEQTLDDLTLKKYQETIVSGGNANGNISLDVSQGTIHKFTLTGNVTKIDISNIDSGGSTTIILTQDGTGGHTLDTTTFPLEWTNFDFVNNFTTLDSTAGAYNIINILYDGSKYYSSLVVDSEISPASLTVTGNITAGNIASQGVTTSTGNISSNASIIGAYLHGDGSNISGLPTLTNAQAQAFIEANGLDMTNAISSNANFTTTANVSGANVIGTYLHGDGSNISGLPSGDITGVTAGSGLTGGGTTGAVTLNIGAGTGITVNADNIQANLSALTTDDLPEGSTNKYYSNTLVNAFIAGNAIRVGQDTDAGTSANTVFFSEGGLGSSTKKLRLSGNTDIVGISTNDTVGLQFVANADANFGQNSNISLSNTSVIKGDGRIDVSGNIEGAVIKGSSIAITGDSSITGNLNVTGNINSETVTDLFVEDRNITLQFGQTGTPSANSQIFVDRGSSSNSYIKWDEGGDAWKFSNDGSTEYAIPASTSDLAEGTNLYFTAARARGQVSVTTGTPSGNGSLTYTSGTGVFDFVPADVPDNTDELSEGSTNQYFTTARANSAISAYTGAITGMTGNLTTTANISGGNVLGTFIGNITGNVTGSPSSLAGLDTDDLSEGTTNQYFTTARANSAITAYTGALTNLTGNIETTGNLILTSTDAGTGAGPDLILYRNSASPDDSDYLGQIQFKGRNDGPGDEIYAKVTGKISDATSGTEDGLIETAIKGDGAFTIVSRQKSDELQLLNGTKLDVAGNITTTANISGGNILGTVRGEVNSTSNITTTANVSGGNVLTDAVTSGASANLTLTGQQNGVHLNKTISSVNSQIIDADTTGYAVGEASAGLPATTTLGAIAPALLVSINHTAGSPTATVNDIYAGALAGVGLDVPAVRGPDFNTGLTGGDIIMCAESGTAGRGNLEAAMTTEGSTSPFIGSPAKSGIANASANLYGQDKGWTVFNISNGSRSDLFPVQAHITGVVNDTITFSENAVASGTTTVALQPGMAQSTVANTNIKYLTKIGDKAAANSGINDNTLYGYLGSFEHPETLANLTYDRLSYSNTSTITFTSIDMKQSADMNSGGDSAVRFPRLLSVGANTTPDPFSGRVETNNPSPIGVTVEDDGETYAGNNAPYSKFLFNTYTGAFDDMTIHPNWATVGNTGNVTLDLPQLKAPSLQFKSFRGEKSDGNVSNYLMQAGEVVGKIQFSPGQTTGLGFQGADLYNPPAAITVDVGDANINTGAANTHMHITTSPYPAGGSLGYFRNNANADSGINQQTNFTTKDGNVTIAAQTDGMITLAPTPDYGDSGNATVWTRFPGTTHGFHTFLDAKFLSSKAGTIIEVQPKSGTTTGSGGLGYDSVGNATIRISSHHSNSAVKAQFDITNEQSSGNLVLRSHSSSKNYVQIDTAAGMDLINVGNITGEGSLDISTTSTNPIRILNNGLELAQKTTTQINAIGSPRTGSMFYNTTLNQIVFYNGSGWRKLTDDAM